MLTYEAKHWEERASRRGDYRSTLFSAPDAFNMSRGPDRHLRVKSATFPLIGTSLLNESSSGQEIDLAVETAHLDPTAVLTAPPAAHRSAAGEFAYRRDRTGASVGGHDRVPEAASDRGGDLEADIEGSSGARVSGRHGCHGASGSASDQPCCIAHLAEALRAADLRAVDLRGVDFWGVDLRGVDFCGAVAGRAAPASAPADRWLIWCRTSAVPPTATSSGHSTRPTAPMAPRVSAAAADE